MACCGRGKGGHWVTSRSSSAGSRRISGRLRPFSKPEIASRVTPRRSASCCCDHPRAPRNSARSRPRIERSTSRFCSCMVAKLTEAELSSNLDRHVSLGADCKVIVSPVALLPWSNMSMRWRPRASWLAVPMRGSKARQALCRCWLRALLLLRPLRSLRRRRSCSTAGSIACRHQFEPPTLGT